MFPLKETKQISKFLLANPVVGCVIAIILVAGIISVEIISGTNIKSKALPLSGTHTNSLSDSAASNSSNTIGYDGDNISKTPQLNSGSVSSSSNVSVQDTGITNSVSSSSEAVVATVDITPTTAYSESGVVVSSSGTVSKVISSTPIPSVIPTATPIVPVAVPSHTSQLTTLGILDSFNRYNGDTTFEYQHEFIAWSSNVNGSLNDSLARTNASGKQLMLTMEPWPDAGDSGDTMLAKTASGVYDSRVQQYCSIIGAQYSTPILRWGHEMETVGSRYPWAVTDNVHYISAFQRMSTICKQASPNIQIMWSPAGKPGSNAYYPGNQYVNLIGLSVFGYPEYEIANWGRVFSIDDTFYGRYHEVSRFGKPIVIAELSVGGNTEYQKNWLDTAMQRFTDRVSYPLMRGFVYFDAGGVDPWQEGIAAPHFWVDPDILKTVMAKYGI